MGLIGREVVQTRIYIDPSDREPPQQNYKESFPITIFDAVRKDINDPNSEKLSDLLIKIQSELQNKQPLFPAKPANYLMTYAGVSGAIGSIQMSMDIPWNPIDQSDDRIPTEKAVGNFMFKLGLIDKDGNIINPDRAKVRYSDIIGRPLMYESLGTNSDGFITQKGINDIINTIKNEFSEEYNSIDTELLSIKTKLDSHTSNYNNPHNLTIDQIGAASSEILSYHIQNFNNPHQVTPEQLGLENVDNTSDMDKPVSIATQEAIDWLKEILNVIQNDSKGFITNISYDIVSGILKITFHDKSTFKFSIPINGLIDEIKYNKETKELDVYELSGEIKHVDLSDLFIRYVGSLSSSVDISIKGIDENGNYIFNAIVVPKGITDKELDDQSVINRILGDQSVTTEKIHDLTISTEKYIDQSVTTEKVAPNAITNTKIADRSINGRTLFSSSMDNGVLVVNEKNTDPYFGKINSNMIEDNGVKTKNIYNKSITSIKLDDNSVITPKIRDNSVTTDKIANLSIINEKIADNEIDGRTLINDINIPGTPTIGIRPDLESCDSKIPDTKWVMNKIEGYISHNHNYGDRTVDGRVLFTSDIRHRVLGVLRANSDPVWTQVDDAMLANNSVRNNHIFDNSITRTKISPKSIYEEHLSNESIPEYAIKTSAISSTKIYPSDNANMVLAALSENSHPVYSKITNSMMAHNSISTDQIEDGSVSLSKITSSDKPNRLIGVSLKNTIPQWVQASTQMIEDGAITVNKIHEVPFRDMVLGSQSAGTHPLWTKINGNMISDNEITSKHIAPSEINSEHIKEKSIESKHILQYQIESDHIMPGAITGSQIFTSPYPNRVLAVTDPYSKADWLQVDSDMIKDKAITKTKFFRSKYDYRILATTQSGTPPEYIKLTNEFIMDDTIRPQKLIRNFTLYGIPQMTEHPPADANGYEIPNTKWVRDTVANMIRDFNPEILYDTIDNDMIKDHAVGPTKIFRSIYPGPRVLGVTAPNEDLEYLLIEEEMIADGSVTTNKIQRSVHLLGSPVLEVRPSPGASEYSGEGNLIPDVQWVLDRISENISNSDGDGSGTTNPVLSGIPMDNSVTTVKIQDRAVTGDKLFTTSDSNKVLAVLDGNTSPVYTKINSEMLSDNSVTSRSIFKSDTDNTILASIKSNSNPIWSKINIDMMDNNSVGTDQLVDLSITGDKIADKSIGREKIIDVAFIDTALLYDNAVTDIKLANNSVVRRTILNNAIDGNKIEENVLLRGYPTVKSGTDYERRSIRNTILSPNSPRGGQPGDIWIKYS